jgi:hypothetical protein
MYRKDYILRMVEMIANVIAGILGLIKKGDFQKASQELDNAYFEYLQQDAALLQSIRKEALTATLLQELNFTNGHLEILSELFYTQAELLYAQGNKTESCDYFEKTLILSDFVIRDSKTFSLVQQSKIVLLQDKIKELKTL